MKAKARAAEERPFGSSTLHDRACAADGGGFLYALHVVSKVVVCDASGRAVRDASGRVNFKWAAEVDAAMQVNREAFGDDGLLEACCALRLGRRRRTRLMHAAHVGDLDRVRRICEASGGLLRKSPPALDPLLDFGESSRSDLEDESMRLYFSSEGDVPLDPERRGIGRTATSFAAAGGRAETMRYLLGLGASAMYALGDAGFNIKRLALVRELCCCKDVTACTALRTALRFGSRLVDVVREKIGDVPADAIDEDNDGIDREDPRVRFGFEDSLEHWANDESEVAKALCEHPYYNNAHRLAAASRAAASNEAGYGPWLDHLLSGVPSLGFVDPADVLCAASRVGRLELVRDCLGNRGADPSSRNAFNRSALHCAIDFKSASVWAHLAESGADLSSTVMDNNGNDCTSLDRICFDKPFCKADSLLAVRLLVQLDAPMKHSPLWYLCQMGDDALVKALLQAKSIDVEEVAWTGMTALMCASAGLNENEDGDDDGSNDGGDDGDGDNVAGRMRCVRALLEYGAVAATQVQRENHGEIKHVGKTARDMASCAAVRDVFDRFVGCAQDEDGEDEDDASRAADAYFAALAASLGGNDGEEAKLFD